MGIEWAFGLQFEGLKNETHQKMGRRLPTKGQEATRKNAHFNRENTSLLRDASRPFQGNSDFEL
jgi:hypothetical protein